MSRALLTAALLVALLALAPAASAQTETAPPGAAPGTESTGEALDEQLARWARVLDRIDRQLDDPNLSLAVLSDLEETVDQARDQLVAVRAPIQSEVERIGALIRALGPTPKEGESPETESVAAQRADLQDRLSIPQGNLRRLGVLVEQANLLESRVAEAQSRVLRAALLVRTPSLLAPGTWARAATEFVQLGGHILRSPVTWYRAPEVRGEIGPGYVAGAMLAVLAAGGVGWFVRRWLIRRFGRKPKIAEPSYRMRVVAALAEATAYTAIPILVVAVAYGALSSRGLLFGPFQHLVSGIVATVVWVSLLYGLPRAMLSPSMSHWRLLHVGDLAARLWYRRALTLAVIVGIDRLIAFPFGGLDPSVLLRFTYACVAGTAIASVFLAIVVDARLWRTPTEEARATATGEPPATPDGDVVRRSNWWLFGRLAVGAIALAVPITALAGYGVLADHIARRLLASAGVFLVALVLHGLARDLVAIFTREDETPPAPDEAASPIYVWSVLLLDIGLVVSIVFFMVPLWGGRWDNIVERIGWVMSGFEVGGRTFSLADVLMGIAVFIVLLILVRLFQRFLDVRILRQTRMDVGVRDALKTGIGYFGVVIAALVAINTAGIDLTGLAIIAGALSVGIGFGMQSIVNNFVSGLILLVERPIKVGDWVVVGQDQGTVKRISVRSTQIQTFSNASVIIPNAELISGRVTNWMYKDNSGRIELPIGVAYGSDTAKVRDVLVDCAKAHPGVKAWPQPYVVFMDFGDSALLFQLRFFISDMNNCLSTSSDLRFAIDAAFREAGITIPFPQRDVHVIDPGDSEAITGDAAAAPSGKVLPLRKRRRTDEREVETDADS